MTGVTLPPDPKRKWYGLALRHQRMARRLLRLGFPDGAVFHAYHAYECALSALIAAAGYAVPPEGWTSFTLPSGKRAHYYPSPSGQIRERSAHKARVLLFSELANHTAGYYALFQVLSRTITVDDRNAALYYDATYDQLPHQRFNINFAASLLPKVWKFVSAVWIEVR